MESKHRKDFAGWHKFKTEIANLHEAPTFREREVWWCSVGVNVGYEIDGKNTFFNRPVLILRKFNTRLFWGVPLSTKIKENPHYHHMVFLGKKQSVLLTHLRLYDSKRITDKLGKISHQLFDAILAKLVKEFLRK